MVAAAMPITLKPDVDAIAPMRNVLGESPLWNAGEAALYWTDIPGKRLCRIQWATRRLDTWPMPDMVGSFAFRRDGTPLLALPDGLATFDPVTAVHSRIVPFDMPVKGQRFNDGKTDPWGRFVVSSMHEDDAVRRPNGSVFSFEPGRKVPIVLLHGIAIPNGLAWSPDGRTLYFADTTRKLIGTYPYCPETGTLGEPHPFADLKDRSGKPDGGTVDEEGCYWSGEVGGGCLTRYAPDGRIVQRFELPVTRPTCCAFGGDRLRTLFVTTASNRLTPEELARQPLAGMVLSFEPGVAGRPEPATAL